MQSGDHRVAASMAIKLSNSYQDYENPLHTRKQQCVPDLSIDLVA